VKADESQSHHRFAANRWIDPADSANVTAKDGNTDLAGTSTSTVPGKSSTSKEKTKKTEDLKKKEMKATTYNVNEGTKAYEFSSYFVRIYRSLFAVVSGDQVTARSWLTNYNIALRGIPLELMKTIRGINEVSTYLDARRAIV
jgi:hypothetical protein